MSSCQDSMALRLQKPRSLMAQHFGAQYQDPQGFLGAYVPAEQYVQGGCFASGCSKTARPLQAACNNEVQAMGPCAAGYGLDSAQLFPTSLDACDGFDNVLVSAPMDFLYADNLMDDVNVLTTTRNQTKDLRGEPTIAPVYSCGESGGHEPGPYGGVLMSTMGPYELRKAVRTFIV